MCTAGSDPAVPGVSTVSGEGQSSLSMREGRLRGRPSRCFPWELLRTVFLTRYLRKAFFPKHQDLQFAGKGGRGWTSISHGSSPDPKKPLYS